MPAIRMTMPQKGISRTMLEMRRRVSEASCASVVRAPKTWRTVRNLAATRLRRCATAVRSCSRAKAARLPLEQAVIQEDAFGGVRRPGVQQRVAFDNGPVTRDGIVVQETDGVEDAGPEVLEGSRGVENGDAEEIEHEDRRALQVDDEDLAR